MSPKGSLALIDRDGNRRLLRTTELASRTSQYAGSILGLSIGKQICSYVGDVLRIATYDLHTRGPGTYMDLSLGIAFDIPAGWEVYSSTGSAAHFHVQDKKGRRQGIILFGPQP